MSGGKLSGKVLVWDLPTRLFHWLLVASLAGSWWTAENGLAWMDWHFRFGYFAAGLIIFRIIWGFVGPRHARFANFIRGPSRVIAYLKTIGKRDATPSTGHNPLGAVAVVAMLAVISFQVATGLFATDDIFTTGPFNPLVSGDLAGTLTSWHHLNFNFILGLSALHIVAIMFYWIWKRQSLIPPMITGRKSAELAGTDTPAKSSRFLLGLVIALLAAGMVYGAVSLAPEPALDEFF